ncbi:MAG TPA: GNAT family N-acetyltransferase [Burkholderiaceae bacterium]|nr:GNAT family N-acetyltransferase [Burkholderiaceae bacterium]HSB99884.1 GNAT family N-acetyltransferase [Burkholderiaceae bacterium]
MPLLDSLVHSQPPPETPRPVTEAPVWVPIRSLAPRHRDRVADHLLALPEHDRYLRFGHAASDEQIRRYVETLNFERDELLGIFNRRLRLLAMAHLAYPPEDELAAGASAEFGVSVAANARGRGYGKRLFDLAVLHARNRGVRTLLIHALSENAPMLRIARHAGAVVERDGAEAQALLKLPADTMASQVEQMVETSAAEWDYRLKQHARRMERLKRALATLAARR